MTRSVSAWVTAWIVLLSCSARADVFNYSSSADSFIRGGSVNANDGSSDILRVRKNGPARTLVRFDQAAISADVAGGTVQSATLELVVESASGWSSGREIDVYRVLTDWVESEVTWSTPSTGAPAWNGGDLAAGATASYLQTNALTGTISIDVTSDVVAFLGSTDNFGWLLKKRLETAGGGVVYTSKEGSATNAPKLVVNVLTATGTPATATPTATPTSTNTPGGATNTPTPLGTLSASCVSIADNPKACDKIATFPLRSLRDWATCLERNDPDTWGLVSGMSPPNNVGCGVYFDDGGSGVNDCNLQSPESISEDELQSSDATATCELERALQHCDYKLVYQNECTLSDWAIVEQHLAGSLPSSPNDVFKYAPDAWYPCIPWQRDTIFKTINDVWLPFLAKRVTCTGGFRDGLSCMAGEGCPSGTCESEITDSCARQAFRAIGESLDEFIHQAGDDNDNGDLKAFWRCEGTFDNVAVKNNCGTCNRPEGASTNGYDSTLDCPGDEMIRAQEWDDLCKFLKARYNPFRQACRQKAGDTTSGPGWDIEPTPTAIP